jgi:hypothetical protein
MPEDPNVIDWPALLERLEELGVDLDQPQDPIRAGVYEVAVTKAIVSHLNSRASWTVTLVVRGGRYDGHHIWAQLAVSKTAPATTKKFFAAAEALGLELEFFDQHPTANTVAEALLGRSCRVLVSKHRDGHTNVNDWLPLDRQPETLF